MAHGGGGRLTHELIDKVFAPVFKNPILDQKHDSATIDMHQGRMAFTTDPYVIHPLFFPGGDIGSLAVNGTVNDLAMSGARPLYLSAGFILEEGLPVKDLLEIARSMRRSADEAGIQMIAGDTKVVDRGKGDGLYINTSGIGIIEHGLNITPRSVTPGDIILLNGDIGRHGIAVMAEREGLSFETTIRSDCAPLSGIVMELIREGLEIHCLRDLTRGGLATALIEISLSGNLEMQIEETAIPIQEEVQGACEILGLDPLYIANEGRFICFIKETEVENALRIMKAHPIGRDASAIGEVRSGTLQRVTLRNRMGTTRILDMLSGEQLPRIC